MKVFRYALLCLCLSSLLLACGKEKSNSGAASTSTGTNSTGSISPVTDKPTLTEDERMSTVAALMPTPIPPSTITPPPPTDDNPKYDPGPYFTSSRASPPDPSNFVPDEQVGNFSRYGLQGTCLKSGGQTAYFRNAENSIIQLICFYKGEAQDELFNLSLSNMVTGDPLLMKLQGAESFLLAASGEGFLFAWTHGAWIFIARSTLGRPPLDEFMQAFKY